MSEQNFSERSFCCLRVQRQACSFCSAPPSPHSRHASTLTRSLGRWAAARVCFPPRCKPGINQRHPRDVKLPVVVVVVAVKTPLAPSGLRVTGITHDRVSLAWDASQSSVANYVIAMREVGSKKFKKVGRVDGSQLAYSLTTGFEQNREYVIRVYAENEVIKYLAAQL